MEPADFEAVLDESETPDNRTSVEIREGHRWPIRIWGADQSYVGLTDAEAQRLMSILIKRYVLEGLADV